MTQTNPSAKRWEPAPRARIAGMGLGSRTQRASSRAKGGIQFPRGAVSPLCIKKSLGFRAKISSRYIYTSRRAVPGETLEEGKKIQHHARQDASWQPLSKRVASEEIPAALQAPERSQSTPPSVPKTRGKEQPPRAKSQRRISGVCCNAMPSSLLRVVRAKASPTKHPVERVKVPPNPSGAAGRGREADSNQAGCFSVISGDIRDHSRDTWLFPTDVKALTGSFGLPQ